LGTTRFLDVISLNSPARMYDVLQQRRHLPWSHGKSSRERILPLVAGGANLKQCHVAMRPGVCDGRSNPGALMGPWSLFPGGSKIFGVQGGSRYDIGTRPPPHYSFFYGTHNSSDHHPSNPSKGHGKARRSALNASCRTQVRAYHQADVYLGRYSTLGMEA
jgi:hypothetical protein